MTEPRYDTIVVGAGMAGLITGRALAEAGQRVLILEARDRIGGRILTHHLHGETVELGAEFVHGRPPELWALIDEAGLETCERGGSQLCFEDGALTDRSNGRDGIFNVLDGLENLTGPDLSFADYLDRQDLDPEECRAIIGFVEGFNAADHRLASAAALGRQQQAEDAIEGDRSLHIVGGYSQIPDFLAGKIRDAGGTLRLNAPVRSIQWQGGHVKVVTDTNSVYAARTAITLPLGVLPEQHSPDYPSSR